MIRIMGCVETKEFRWAQGIAGRARTHDIATDYLSEALLFLGDAYRWENKPSELQRAKAVAFWLSLGHSLSLLSPRDAYACGGTPKPANSNKPGGKCSSRSKPRGTPRRRKLKLSVVT